MTSVRQVESVRHRIDGLETRGSPCLRSWHVRHRIDGLEILHLLLQYLVAVRHRIDGLEIEIMR